MHFVSPLLAKLSWTFYYTKSYVRMLYMLRLELRAELLAGDPAVGVPVVHLLQQTQPPPQNGVILRRGEESRSHGQWETGEQGTHPPLEVLALLGVVTHVPTIRPGGN